MRRCVRRRAAAVRAAARAEPERSRALRPTPQLCGQRRNTPPGRPPPAARTFLKRRRKRVELQSRREKIVSFNPAVTRTEFTRASTSRAEGVSARRDAIAPPVERIVF